MLPAIQVLLVMSPERRSQVAEILESSQIQFRAAGSCQEARRLLAADATSDVVITQLSHADGNWCDLLKWLIDRRIDASIVVTCTQADERLWSEVLWRGAYDLLVEPYESWEVCRVVEGAARASSGHLGKVAAHQG